MAYRLAPGVAMLPVKDRAGIIYHHYSGPVAGFADGRNRGPIIDWISDEQRDHFLNHRLIEAVEDQTAANTGTAQGHPPIIIEGTPEARRRAGHSFPSPRDGDDSAGDTGQV